MTARIFVWPKSRRAAKRNRTTSIGIHCTATREGNFVDATTVDQWHREKKWSGIGYAYLIHIDGTIEAGRPDDLIGSHVYGHNAESVGVCYVGGLDKLGRPKDTRTEAQKVSLATIVRHLKAKYKVSVVKGHRDYSPDKDGDGIIEPFEWLKACPCFDVIAWAKTL